VLAAGDGALDYIPVMAFYWFTYTVFLCDWPGRLSRLIVDRERARKPRPGTGTAARTLAHT
jgi:hypothetical protein